MAPRLKVQKALVVIKKMHSMSLGHAQLNGFVNGKTFAKCNLPFSRIFCNPDVLRAR